MGDEESFLTYEEKVVYDLQKAWSGKAGMDNLALMDTCAKLEDLIYNDALKEYNLSATANVWSKKECILYFQEKCDILLHNIESKELNWKKLYDESRMNTRHVLQTIMKSDGDRAYKNASRALMPKARKSTLGGAARETPGPKKKPGVPKSTGKRGRVSGANLTLQGSTSFSSGLGEYVDGGDYGGESHSIDAVHHVDDGGEHDMMVADPGLDEFGFDFEEEGNAYNPPGGQEASLAVDDEAWMS